MRNHRKKAQLSMAQQTLAELTSTPATPVHNPIGELQRLAGEAVRLKDILTEKASELEQLTVPGNEDLIHGVVILLERALDRCATILTAMVRLNLDERLVLFEEERTRMLASLIRRILDPLELSESQLARAQASIPGQVAAFLRRHGEDAS